jgi:MFS transporter, BCD family, chlorophyll transporter
VLGVDKAARLACWVMAVPQVAVITLLLLWGRPVHAGIVAALLVAQFVLMRRLLRDPGTSSLVQRHRHHALRARHARQRLRRADLRHRWTMNGQPIGWLGIVRLGLVQASLGSIVVLTTSMLNRVMVVELMLPALLPGALVALYYTIQLLRPRLGYGSDVSGRRTPWIVGGMAVLAIGGYAAAAATAWMDSALIPGLLLAIVAFILIGVGVGAAGTSLLVLLAKRVEPRRRPTAATVVWLMMILGFIVTTALAGRFLDPFSPARLMAVSGGVSILAFLVTLVAVWGVEGHNAEPAAAQPTAADDAPASPRPDEVVAAATTKAADAPFRQALAEVWAEPVARQFTLFVFISMLAYGAQDLVLEPFAGAVFGLTPGESTMLSSTQYQGILLGMLLVGGLGPRFGSLRSWMIGGCLGSSAALLGLACAGFLGAAFPLRPAVFVLGVGLGIFAVAAIGSMMGLVDAGRERREGIRMGLFGAAQAIAVGLGGIVATAGVDLVRWLSGSPLWAYSLVFVAEALTFALAAILAARIGRIAEARRRLTIKTAGGGYAAGLGGG